MKDSQQEECAQGGYNNITSYLKCVSEYFYLFC